MKIRIVEAGYEKFTGSFGTVEFENGVSVHSVSDSEARLLAAIVTVVPEGGDTDLSASARFQAAKDVPAFVETLPTFAELIASGKMEGSDVKQEPQEAPVAESPAFTRRDLEEIADSGGIAALRSIAEPLGIRGNSVAKLIQSILVAQNPEPQVVALPEGQPDVVTSEKAE